MTKQRGYYTLKIGGKNRTLHFSMNFWATFTDMLDISLDEIGGVVFINANSYFDGTQPTLVGLGDTGAPTSGTIAITPEDPGGQVTGAGDDTAEVTPGKFLAGQLEIIDTTDGVLAVGDLADFNAGLAS